MSIFFVDPNIAKAKTLDTDFYTSPVHFEAVKEKIFAPSWQFIGSKEMVKFAGDVQPFTLLPDFANEPLLLTHDKNGKINCLSNVCTHRGNLVAYKACSKANTLRCKYHGRLFDLDGKFISMPEFNEVENFPCKDDHLPRLPLFNWGDLLFTSLQQQEDGHIYFQEMMERLSWLPINEFVHRADLSKSFEVDANWALYCENYLEGFHIPFVHAALNAALSFGDYTTELYAKSSLQLGIGKDAEIVENVQKGIVSRFYRHGRYSVTRESGTHHFHRLIAESMKPHHT